MRKNHKIIMAALLVNLSSVSLVMGADERGDEGKEGPLTPRTSAFCKFAGEVAREECGSEWKIKGERRVLEARAADGSLSLVGLFPADSKLSQVLSFLEEVSGTPGKYPVTPYAESEDGCTTRIVQDIPNSRFLITSYRLPLPLGEPLAALPMQQQQEPEHYEVLLSRLEGFLSKAGKDVSVQGERFGEFLHREVRPTIEQEARNTGKALEAAGKNIGRLLGRKKR